MQITLNVDASSLAKMAEDTVGTLTADQKTELVADVLRKTVGDQLVATHENNKAHIAKLFIQYMQNSGSWNRGRYDGYTFEQLEPIAEFRAWYDTKAATFKESVHVTLLEELHNEAVRQIKGLVQTDPEIQAAITSALSQVRTKLPEIIQQSLVVHFTQSFSALASQAASQAMQINQVQENVKQLLERVRA